MRKLDFVIAGAQKSGTTTLDAIFRQHPKLQMASLKETHFFDDESLNWEFPDYCRLDAFYNALDERPRGEATPITLYWRPAIRRLHAYNPDIRLICLLRNPVERTFSNWRKEYASGLEALLFRDAIREGRERVRLEAETEGLHRFFSYVERSFYGQQLSYMLKFFPRRQIHLEISEEFFGARTAGLARLSNFLGIDPFPEDIPPLHENPGRALAYPSTLTPEDAAYLAGLFCNDVRQVEALLGRSISSWRNLIGE